MDCTITPLSAHTGAEVRGIDLTRPVDEAARVRLNRAFVDHSVLVFRDQHLTPHQRKEALARRERGEESQTDIARSYNVSHSTISRLKP